MSFLDFLTSILETLGMSISSCALAYLFGLPTGILLNITSKKGIMPCKWLNTIVGLIINILRSIPCLIIIVVLIPVVRMIFSMGTGEWYTIIVPLFVASYGFVSRIVEQSLAEVDSGKIEAIESLGATKFQIITKVLIPETKSSLVSGLAVALVSIIGYTSFAYNISANGLIADIYLHYKNNTADYMKYPEFWILIILVILIVQGIQEIGLMISKKLDKRRII